jgi:pyruvate/2-oxoglutarate dehydrogenase complex dihydrolipoamide dehydrogenase (E3) component/uncharacterized membrane protein YdjX (TVP38/TMEM64 family)
MPRVLFVAVVLALIGAFFLLDLGRFVSFDYIKTQQQLVKSVYVAWPWPTIVVFLAVYITVTGLSLPGATVMTVFAGALFGLGVGTVAVSFASTIGATLSFLGSRWLFRDIVQRRFGARLQAINRGIELEGPFYLFALRLVPVVPFFAINVAMALSPIRLWPFAWVSQVGMLLGTVAYVNAGTQLAQIESPSGILAPGVVASFAALGMLPLLAKRVMDAARARRVYRRWPRPRRFDRNLVVIGAGSAGLVSAYIAATVKAKVTLVEKQRMGGDCLHTGCVPSKALLRSARLLAQMSRAGDLGIRTAHAEFDFADVMAHVQRVVEEVAPHDSVERYTALGVECLEGEASIVSPWEVEVRTVGERRKLTTRSIVIAAGAHPVVPAIPGIEDTGYLTSETVWGLRELPRRLLVLGGGPIGTELAQAFARFGSRVTQVERLPRILAREDPEVSTAVTKQFRTEGIDVRTEHEVGRFLVEDGQHILVATHEGREVRIPFDVLLCAVGRVANTTGYGLEALGIPTTARHTIDTNQYLETLFPNIYACGDVTGPYQFTHTASHQAWYASVNALFGRFRKFRVDYAVIPWATFTEPEVARVGLNETEAREQGVAHEITTYGLEELDRAIVDRAASGFVKVLTVPGRDRILGATIVGAHASELIVEFILAMKYGLGLEKILNTIHVYPTMSEANKQVAGKWRKARVSPRTTRLLERYHHWMRGGE